MKCHVMNDYRHWLIAAALSFTVVAAHAANDYIVAASGGDITGAKLSALLATKNVVLQSNGGTKPGSGNVIINDAVIWSANTQLTLVASNNISINAGITATGGKAGITINPDTANGSEKESGTGTYNLNNGASINLPDVSPSSMTALVISKFSYAVINKLGAAGSLTATDLQGMNGNLSAHYALGSNMDAAASKDWNVAAEPASGFMPIGAKGGKYGNFTGTFDGLGHTINNLSINIAEEKNVGLFGLADAGSVIRNVGLLGGKTSGSYNVGALVGFNAGAISNSYTTGSVSGTGNNVGGLVGFNAGTVSNSYATGGVNGTGNNVGGLVGANSIGFGDTATTYGKISGSYATGSVSGGGNNVGGLVGYNDDIDSSVTSCYATGNAHGTNFVGGLVGFNDDKDDNNHATISDSYAAGKASGSSYVGGLAGYNNDKGAISNSYWNSEVSPRLSGIGGGTLTGTTGLSSAEMMTSSKFNAPFTFATATDLAGWVIVDADGTLNNADGAAGATFPMLASEYSTSIHNAHQLQLVAVAPGANYIQGIDIDASSTSVTGSDVWSSSGFVPIGNEAAPFADAFDGAGHTITNLTINRPTVNAGLFGRTGVHSAIRNAGLNGVNVSGSGEYAGGLVGINDGTVSNSYVTGNVSGNGGYIGGLVGSNNGTISNSYATGSMSKGEYAGGLAGINSGNISNSYTDASVNGISHAGGLAGINYKTISDSYARGNVTGTGRANAYLGGLVGDNTGTIRNSYATGRVSGASAGENILVGGLAGQNTDTVINSFWNSEINPGLSGIGGGVTDGATGMNTNDMQAKANYTSATAANGGVNPDWDFNKIWELKNGAYPMLKNLPPAP